MHFPLETLRRFERMSHEERDVVRERNRELYANPLSDEPHTSDRRDTKAGDDQPSRPSRRPRRSPDD
jgi:hypothetical protein